MGAIGLNPIRLDRIGLDPIRINAIKLGVPGAASDRPYIDPEVLASLKAVCICYGKSNDDPDRAVVKNLVDPDNPFVISNAAYTEGSGYADKDSSYYGAFVTDGIDDLITSTKTVQEMLGGSNELTIVSMVHQVKDSANNVSFTNYIRGSANGYFRNIVNNYDKTGIYGYTSSDLMGLSVVNNILGDKNDYTSNGDNRDSIINGNFSVQGYSYNDGNNTGDFSSVAWYWTVIANKVLTTDQINQVIAYYNLDRCVEPTVWYDVQKQGLSNDTPDSDWYLKDYSGNGYDMTLYNYAKTPESGINEDGGLQSDGVDDYGKVTGLPIYKDYTVVADYVRTFAKENVQDAPILSKSQVAGDGAFLFNYLNVNSVISSYSFGTNNVLTNVSDSERKIYYQSKYVNGGKSINSGTGTDYDSMWLGTYRDDSQIFFTGAIYSLMTFPYSMSEFLIERQLKKHKLGTLYPDMVEFRPIVKANTNYNDIVYYAVNGSNWTRIYPGDYIPVGQMVSFTVNLDLPYKVSKASSFSLKNISVRNSSGSSNSYDIIATVTDKSPQRINITIEQDENYVQWNPVVESNVPYKSLRYYNNIQGTGWKQFYVGEYLPIGSTVLTRVNLNGSVDELSSATSSQLKNIQINRNGPAEYDINGAITSESPQKINITIDEYIRYEDIVQPYPVLLRLKDENGNEVSWGGKVKLGSSITRIGSFNDCNLLKGIYTVSNAKLNGSPLPSTPHVVERQMVFTCTATYLLDNNEPKCILSPSRLRIPNSSYKILGHIPDISGHGNHGVIHNSAYVGMSGANGYPYDYNKSSDFSAITNYVKIINSEKFEYFGYTNSVTFYKKTSSYKGKIKITGLNNAIASGKIRHFQVYTNSTTDTETSVLTTDGIYNINITGVGDATNVYFYILPVNTAETGTLDEPIYIEQIGEYEGAYCLDGVDDFITIPTTVGGKQVLMKVNWQSSIAHGMLYDQRGYDNEFAIWNSNSLNDNEDDVLPAYSARNNGQTYIDGILNNNIKASELRAITHNITITNELSSGVNNTYPVIGANKTVNAYFVNMALYDFMLFDEISTDDKIKELNEYVGIEGNTDDLFNENN